MRSRASLVALATLLVAAAPLAAKTPRRACVQACGAPLGECSTQPKPRARKRCRAAVITLCRKHGVATCEPLSTTTTATTTTEPANTTTTMCRADGQSCAAAGECCSGACDAGLSVCVAAGNSTTSTSTPIGSSTTSTTVPQCEPVPCDLGGASGCCQYVGGVGGLCCASGVFCDAGALCCCSGVCIDHRCY